MKIDYVIKRNLNKPPEHKNLLHVGKSNKKFTHNEIYIFFGNINETLVIYDNKNNRKVFNDKYLNYLEKNFKIITNSELIVSIEN